MPNETQVISNSPTSMPKSQPTHSVRIMHNCDDNDFIEDSECQHNLQLDSAVHSDVVQMLAVIGDLFDDDDLGWLLQSLTEMFLCVLPHQKATWSEGISKGNILVLLIKRVSHFCDQWIEVIPILWTGTVDSISAIITNVNRPLLLMWMQPVTTYNYGDYMKLSWAFIAKWPDGMNSKCSCVKCDVLLSFSREKFLLCVYLHVQ